MDFLGGFFSFCQIIVDSGARGKSLFGNDAGFNIVKFMLSIITLIFDLIFLFQHYVLYYPKKPIKKPMPIKIASPPS